MSVPSLGRDLPCRPSFHEIPGESRYQKTRELQARLAAEIEAMASHCKNNFNDSWSSLIKAEAQSSLSEGQHYRAKSPSEAIVEHQ